jgi:hypothetical protein
MAPAGIASVKAAKREGTWSLLDEVESLVVPEDLARAGRAPFGFEFRAAGAVRAAPCARVDPQREAARDARRAGRGNGAPRRDGYRDDPVAAGFEAIMHAMRSGEPFR